MYKFEQGIAGWVIKDAESGHVLAIGDRATIRTLHARQWGHRTNEADRLDPCNLIALASMVGPECVAEARRFAALLVK